MALMHFPLQIKEFIENNDKKSFHNLAERWLKGDLKWLKGIGFNVS